MRVARWGWAEQMLRCVAVQVLKSTALAQRLAGVFVKLGYCLVSLCVRVGQRSMLYRNAMRACIAALLACPCRCLVAHGNLTMASQGAGSTFTLVAGVSATSEMCVTASGEHVVLEPCLAAIAAGDGSCLPCPWRKLL